MMKKVSDYSLMSLTLQVIVRNLPICSDRDLFDAIVAGAKLHKIRVDGICTIKNTNEYAVVKGSKIRQIYPANPRFNGSVKGGA
jgi:hypothetical protein